MGPDACEGGRRGLASRDLLGARVVDFESKVAEGIVTLTGLSQLTLVFGNFAAGRRR